MRVRKVRFCILLLALTALAGCGSSEEKKASQTTSYGGGERLGQGAELFTVPQEQLSHLQIVIVAPTTLPRSLRLTGTVAYNAFKTTPVFSPIGGPVSRILAAPGQVVRQGQALAEVSSPDYSQLLAAYLKAREAFHVADKNYARAQDLYTHHAVAERDLLQAESDRSLAKADLDASEQSLRILGVRDPEALANSPVRPVIPILAPISGEVVERLISPGQLLQAATTQAFTISDTGTVWVLVNVYQNDLAYVRAGDPVSIQTDAYPQIFRGTISYIAPALDPATRTLQARIVTENPGGKLKKDMYVTAAVAAGAYRHAIAVPDAAVLRDSENMPFVYVQAENQQQAQFAKRPVQIGDSQNGQTQILGGLKAGERVVGDGSLFLQFANSLQH